MDEISYQDMVKAARAENEYLGYIDMEPGGRATVTIESVIKKKNVSSRGKTINTVHFLKLKGTEKLLWLNIGKLRSLELVLGRVAAKWAGQKIVLFADPSVRYRGSTGGIVIEAAK